MPVAKEPRLTEKQAAYAIAMFTAGSETFSNGVKSAKAARYKGSYWTLNQISIDNLQKPIIINEKQRIQAKTAKKMDYDRDKALELLTTDYGYLLALAKDGNIQAIQARTAIVRELDAISGLQSSTLITKDDQPTAISDEQAAEWRRMAKLANVDRLKQA